MSCKNIIYGFGVEVIEVEGKSNHLLAARDLFCCLAIPVEFCGRLSRRLTFSVRLRRGVMILDFGFLVAEA
jgi:hypothetical protein